jgi:hypothetical protein
MAKSIEEYRKEMESVPCYTPAPPFYDFCNRVGHPAEGHDCDKCLEQHGLADAIE